MSTSKKVLFLALSSALFCSAQINRATLTGVVTDPSGASVPTVKITATHVATGVNSGTTATETGNYTLTALPIGSYRVSYEAQGFKKSVRDQVTLTGGDTLRLDVALELGSVGESVQVSAQSSPIQTESTRVSTNISTKLIDDLPLQVNGGIRSILNLAIIAPETKTANGFRIGGGQGSAWDMSMDGMPTTSGTLFYQEQRAPVSTVPIDAISEFTVETTGMKAERGRSAGAISFETKSGTNQIHGNLFEYLRNNAMDARGFFNTSAPIVKQHDFGGTVGGPVVLPKIYNGRNKTFFFASYQGFRNRAGAGAQYLTIPTLANYEGDFSGWTRNGVKVPIYDPASTRANPTNTGFVRDAFANNLIPKSRFSQVATRYIGLRPAEMVPNTFNRNGFGDPVQNYYTEKGSAISPWNKGSVRIDQSFGSNDRISFLWLRGVWQDKFGVDGPPGLPVPFNGQSQWARKNASGRFAWDRTISSRIINTFRVSYQLERADLATINSVNASDKWNEKLKIPNVPGPDQALPGLSFTGYTGWSGNSWGLDAGGNLNLTDDVTIIKNNHTIKTGFFHAHDRWDGGGQHRPNGGFGFTNLATAIPGDQSQNTGNGFASFLLGYASSSGLETPRIVRQYYKYYGGYLQDDWKITPRITINIGLRYEYTTTVRGGAYTGLTSWDSYRDSDSTGKIDGFSNFDPNEPNPGAGGRPGALIFTGEGPGRYKGSLFDGYKRGISPRLGLVFRVTNGTVIRAYGGRQLGAVKTTGASTHFDGFIVNTNISSTDNSINDFPALLDNGPPAYVKPPFINAAVQNNQDVAFWQRQDSGRPTEYYMWNLDIQRELGQSMALTVGYSGTKGTYLASGLVRINQIDPKYIDQYGVTLLNSSITSAAARTANIPIPYTGFGSSTTHTVRRALQPFPQYGNIFTNGGQPASVGERAGNSTYHALVMKVDRRYKAGLTLLGSYVFSKMFTDSDTALIGSAGSLDHFNRGLEKALSANDQTHMARVAFSYELPVGKGKAMDLGRFGNLLLGEWSTAGNMSYESGTPDSVSSPFNPIGTGARVYVTSYENWRAPIKGDKFDPFVDVWYDRNQFNQGLTTAQQNAGFGNATRNNPKLRTPWRLNENVSLGKNFSVAERFRFSLRGEAFNVLNRVRWGGPTNGINATGFGQVRGQGNDPRRVQVSLKMTF